MQNSEKDLFFEKQKKMSLQCGMHSVNNLLREPLYK